MDSSDFNSSIDSKYLPKIGDIYVQNSLSELFPFAFVGRVISIENIGDRHKIVTTFVPLDSIFSELTIDKDLDVTNAKVFDENGNEINTEKGQWPDDESEYVGVDEETTIDNKQYKLDSRAEAKFTIAQKWNAKFIDTPHIKATGKITIGGYITIKTDLLKEFFSIDAKVKAELSGDFSGGFISKIGYDETNKKLGNLWFAVPGLPALQLHIPIYVYTSNESELKFSTKFKIGVIPKMKLVFNKQQFDGSLSLKANKGFLDANSSVSLSGKVDYGLGLRLYMGLGVANKTIAKMDYVYLDAKSNIKASSKLELASNSDEIPGDMTYQVLKDTKINISATAGLYAEKKGFLRIFGKLFNRNNNSYKNKIEKEFKYDIATLRILPTPSGWSKENLSNSSVRLKLINSGVLLLPITPGVSLYKDGEFVKKVFAQKSYFIPDEFICEFNNLDAGSYCAYPTYKLFGKELVADTKDSYVFNVLSSKEPKAVDLGLSVKWGDRNYGASSVTGKGVMCGFAQPDAKDIWGEHKNPPENISGGEYDIVRVHVGNGWRLPTRNEFLELYNKCTWQWTSRNGRNGYNITGPNGSAIFLPAYGEYWGYSGLADDNEVCGYWSGTGFISDDGAYFGCCITQSETSNMPQGVWGMLGIGLGLCFRPVIPY